MTDETTFATFIHWALLSVGLIYFITDSLIFSHVRVALARGSLFRIGLFYCPACMGFWVGAALGLGGWWPIERGLDGWGPVFEALESGIAAMALGAFWGRINPGSAFEIERQELGLGVDNEETRAHDETTESQNE
jgi:hypothetical protein